MDTILLVLAIACISWTVPQEEIFKEFREWCNSKSEHKNLIVRKLCYLPTCHYCFSHYVTALFILLTGYKMVLDDWRGYIVAEFALVLLVNVLLTNYNILRVVLRWSKAKADLTEAQIRVTLRHRHKKVEFKAVA